MIYIHVPFCRSFCTYCDFYSEVCGREAVAFEQYTDDICAEIRARRDEIAAATGVRTLYIGGGTPSVLPLECLQKIVGELKLAEAPVRPGRDSSESGQEFGPWEEFTIEVNPEDIVERGADYVRSLLALGVNRISMGVQSLDDGMLRWMNRRHSADGAREAWRIISEAGQGKHWQLDRSIDLISGVPGMGLKMLSETLDEVLEWRPEHISAYQLSVEEGSALAAMIARGQVAELPEEDCRAQYDLVCRKLAAAGYHHYEISNWALPGHEAKHNSAYWTRAPYVGLGPGAHSLEITPSRQIRKWNSKQTTGWAEEGREVLSPEEIHEESVMLLARTDRGPIPESDWFVADDLIADLV